jgi:hypothetical protein
MKVLAALIVWFCLAIPASAAAYTTPAQLGVVASRIAGQPVVVYCYDHGEDGDPLTNDAWGYVYLAIPVENMAEEVCDGALGIANNSQPRWEQALGALVISHESFHLNLSFKNRGNEGRTECRAIKHTRDTMLQLGASEERADELMPYALAIHYRIAARFPEYFYKPCNVPWFWG